MPGIHRRHFSGEIENYADRSANLFRRNNEADFAFAYHLQLNIKNARSVFKKGTA
jgi:hypothetical protein